MKIHLKDQVLLVTHVQQLDEQGGSILHRQILEELPKATVRVEIDLSQVTSVDGTGLSKLVSIQKAIRKQANLNPSLHLIKPSAPVMQMLRLTRMERNFTIVNGSNPQQKRKKKALLPLFVFVDACGWEILKEDPFADQQAPFRRKLKSVFGYSSACIPSILSGRWPVDTRNWCYFVRDPGNSPFRSLKSLGWLPRAVTSRRIFRRWLSKFIRGPLKFRGYFDLYNIPFRHIGLFDFTEKKNPLEPKGLNKGPNIFDHLTDAGIPYHVSVPTRPEFENLQALDADIASEAIDFAFLYWPALDGLMHETGNQSPRISDKLREYEKWLDQLMATARNHYEDVELYVFSDHGMANCDHLLDLKARINALSLRMPQDYTVVYDSTMARFWFANDTARAAITACLDGVNNGRILGDAELESLGTLFPDRYFGEMIFLADEGVLIVPSDMGERPLRGMHGYHPNAPQSYASMLTNVENLDATVTDIPHIYKLMVDGASRAHVANKSESAVESRSVEAVVTR
ncbi:MAG: alkaline phosphatase family protein [Opitutales bacterium]|nr:alkaline phosphatase family protein [Opitutales bacterium]